MKVEFINSINKIDKEGANPDKVKETKTLEGPGMETISWLSSISC